MVNVGSKRERYGCFLVVVKCPLLSGLFVSDERRQELDQRHTQALDANASPQGYESPASKRRRLGRRRAAQRRFRVAMEQMEQLSLQEAAAGGGDVVTVATGETAPPVPTVVGQGATSQLSAGAPVQRATDPQANPRRMREAERARSRRSNMTDSQRESARRRDAERKLARRAQLRAEQLQDVRERNLIVQQERRHNLNEEVHAAERECNSASRALHRSVQDRTEERRTDREQHADRRVQFTQEERAEAQRVNQEQHAERRSQLTQEQRAEERMANQEQHAERRSQLTQEERAEARRVTKSNMRNAAENRLRKKHWSNARESDFGVDRLDVERRWQTTTILTWPTSRVQTL
ncbi:uncharacterized protein KRP23_5220 [Phytophthora ramorum]|uniref:uncharacterized protein n=1 Tax=Phytophthora ramorum TaxID=164328 RepID=UPI00309E1AE3|nr:hypothetical protein KRP23_5220 [Phytophthora ramorum]